MQSNLPFETVQSCNTEPPGVEAGPVSSVMHKAARRVAAENAVPFEQDGSSQPKERFVPAHFVEAIHRSMCQAKEAGVVLQSPDPSEYLGRYIDLDGTSLLNFGGCSYLGLELRPELRRGVVDAVSRYGTQLSFSRIYLSCPLYAELESLLERMTGGHVLVAPTTTLAHVAALPVLVEPGDAVLVDQFAHASLHTAIALLKGSHVELIRHGHMELLERRIDVLARRHRRVWCVFDGLYSMIGDFAPFGSFSELLDRHPKLHLYIDDAHSTSWIGKHGRGAALDALRDTRRVVVALSLNKAFSAAGAALVFADPERRSRVRLCGGPLLFSGPIQPPMLGAAVASAELHLDPSFAELQNDLAERIDLVLSLAGRLDVPLASHDRTPIFFVRCGAEDVAYSVVRALRASGVYLCPSAFPAVPHKQAGIRFTVSLHNRLDDIRLLMDLVALETKRRNIRAGSRTALEEAVARQHEQVHAHEQTVGQISER